VKSLIQLGYKEEKQLGGVIFGSKLTLITPWTRRRRRRRKG